MPNEVLETDIRFDMEKRLNAGLLGAAVCFEKTATAEAENNIQYLVIQCLSNT
jgi:hypothetical protein